MRNLAASEPTSYERLETLQRTLWVAISAYGLALTYFSTHFAALAWVTLVPFFLVIRSASLRSAAGFGLLYGVTFFGLYGIVKVGALSAALLEFTLLGTCCFVPLALGINLLTRRLGFNPLVLALAWLIYELIRIELLLNLGTLADSRQLHGPTLTIVALTGLVGLSFLIVLVNVLLIRLWKWALRNLWSTSVHTWPRHPYRRSMSELIPVQKPLYFLPEERGPPRGLPVLP